MSVKNKKYIALSCFTLIGLWSLIDCVKSQSFTLLNILSFAAPLLVAFSIFKPHPHLSTVGFALWTPVPLLVYVSVLEYIFEGWIPFSSILSSFVTSICYLLLLVAVINPKSTKTLGTAAASLKFVWFIVFVVLRGYFSIRSFLLAFLLIIGALTLTSFYAEIRNAPLSNSTTSPANNPNSTPQTAGSSEFETLVKLKQLLDDGVITTEEFEAKKKQLLGL